MKNDIIYYIVGGAVFAGAIGYTMYSSSDDTSSVKEPRSASSNVSNYRKGIISDYWDQKYPGTQAGGSKRKRKGSNKTKKQKR